MLTKIQFSLVHSSLVGSDGTSLALVREESALIASFEDPYGYFGLRGSDGSHYMKITEVANTFFKWPP
jgi:hypothetical protein